MATGVWQTFFRRAVAVARSRSCGRVLALAAACTRRRCRRSCVAVCVLVCVLVVLVAAVRACARALLPLPWVRMVTDDDVRAGVRWPISWRDLRHIQQNCRNGNLRHFGR